MYCTGLGKAILASLEDSEIEAYLHHVELKPYTSLTIANREALLAQIREIRA